jgi:hypothetical protein
LIKLIAFVLIFKASSAAHGQDYFDSFAQLALDCVHQEYPNHILHYVGGPDEMGEPHELYPAFYGCFDWHSSVHGHWLLTRLLHLDEAGSRKGAAQSALGRSFTKQNIIGEVAYFNGEDRGGFERPYGRAWYLQLISELSEWQHPNAQHWLGVLSPLEAVIVDQTSQWLPNLNYAVRSGTHNQTAFAFGLMLDYARTVGDIEFENILQAKIEQFYLQDRDCPLAYEPSGEDFLSPCLMEADLMRRVMSSEQYAVWLTGFLPQIPKNGSADWLAVGIVTDPSDGKLVHLDGLNLSRAWALKGMAAALPASDPRVASLLANAELHAQSGLAAVTGEHYAGGHWLASFATYMLSERGQRAD